MGRGLVAAREARAVDHGGVRSVCGDGLLDHVGARRRRAAAPEPRAQALDQALGQVVVGRPVGQADDRAHRRRADRGQRLGPGRRGSGGRLARHGDALALERPHQLARGVGGGLEDVGAAAGGQVAVEAQGRERAHVGVDAPEPLVGHAAQGVPGRLVADHVALHAAQAGGAQLLGQALDRRVTAVVAARERARAEGGVAAALEHEVAAQRAVAADAGGRHRAGVQRPGHAEAAQRRRRRVELLDRGRRLGSLGLGGEQLGAACGIEHVRAGVRARGAQDCAQTVG